MESQDKDAVIIAYMCDVYRESKCLVLRDTMRDVLRVVRDIEASFKWNEDHHDADEN